ncbi:MAG: hypothetical protein ABI629_12430 [bacterium]
MQGAYDADNPNGTGRFPQGTRVTYLFRLYRKLTPPDLIPDGAEAAAGGDRGILETIRSDVQAARAFLQSKILQPLQSSAHQGRVLVREIKVPLIIESRDEVPDVRSHFSYVRGGIPGENFFIDLPFRNAKGVTHFRISFRTFWTPIQVDGVTVDGDSCLLDLQQLVEDYLYPPDGGSTSDFELYWVDLLAAVSAEDPFGASEWWIHPPRNGVRVRQSSQRPFTRFGSLEFLGLRSNRDLAKAEDGLLGSLFGLGTLSNLLSAIGLGGLVELMTAVFGVIKEVQGLIDDINAVVAAVIDVIVGIRQFIQVTVAKIRGLLNGIQQIIGQLEEAYELARDIPSLLDDQLRLLRQSFPGLVDDPDSAVVLTDSLARTRDFLLAVVADPSKFVPPLATGPTLPQTIALQIPPGTTIERLARDANVSAETLVNANGLRYPFVDARVRTEHIATAAAAARSAVAVPGADPTATFKSALADSERALAWVRTQGIAVDSVIAALFKTAVAAAQSAYDRARTGGAAVATAGELAALAAAESAAADIAVRLPSQPGVLYAGDAVRIPQERTEQIPSVVGIDGSRLNLIASSTGSAVTEDERLFGIDFFLDDDGNLEWDADRRDLRLDRGLEHMANVLARYVRLPLGALRFAPGVGNYAFDDLAKWQTPSDNRRLAYAIHRTLSQDPRVRTVRSVRAESYAGVAQIRFDADLINGQRVTDLRAPLQAAA